jgi:hypothetical protein
LSKLDSNKKEKVNEDEKEKSLSQSVTDTSLQIVSIDPLKENKDERSFEKQKSLIEEVHPLIEDKVNTLKIEETSDESQIAKSSTKAIEKETIKNGVL